MNPFPARVRNSLPVLPFRPTRRAHAHSGTESYAYVVVNGAAITGNVQFPVTALNAVLGLSLPTDKAGLLAEMAAHKQAIESYAGEHFNVGAWGVQFTGHRALERKVGSYAILDYVVTGAPNPVPRQFAIRYDAIIHANQHHQSLILLRTAAGIGPLQRLTEKRLPCSERQEVHDVILPEESLGKDVGGAFIAAGAEARRLLRRVGKRIGRIGS